MCACVWSCECVCGRHLCVFGGVRVCASDACVCVCVCVFIVRVCAADACVCVCVCVFIVRVCASDACVCMCVCFYCACVCVRSLCLRLMIGVDFAGLDGKAFRMSSIPPLPSALERTIKIKKGNDQLGKLAMTTTPARGTAKSDDVDRWNERFIYSTMNPENSISCTGVKKSLVLEPRTS